MAWGYQPPYDRKRRTGGRSSLGPFYRFKLNSLRQLASKMTETEKGDTWLEVLKGLETEEEVPVPV